MGFEPRTIFWLFVIPIYGLVSICSTYPGYIFFNSQDGGSFSNVIEHRSALLLSFLTALVLLFKIFQITSHFRILWASILGGSFSYGFSPLPGSMWVFLINYLYITKLLFSLGNANGFQRLQLRVVCGNLVHNTNIEY